MPDTNTKPRKRVGIARRPTTTARDAIAQAAEGLGGAERLVAWAKEDPSKEKTFWGTI